MATLALFGGPIADYLIAEAVLTSTQVRKIFTCVGTFYIHSVKYNVVNIADID